MGRTRPVPPRSGSEHHPRNHSPGCRHSRTKPDAPSRSQGRPVFAVARDGELSRLRPTWIYPDIRKISRSGSVMSSTRVSLFEHEGPGSPPRIQKFHGRGRFSRDWNSLRRDPDLWNDGDCLIYLYARGQSQRGPSFNIPFSALLHADCHPLIDRYMAPDTDPYSTQATDYTGPAKPAHMVEIYMPPPPDVSKTQSFAHHLATRNFFAWLCREPLVGEYLGTALAALLGSMRELRLEGVDSVGDIIDYMEEEGYLDMKNNPQYAVAMLHLAEEFQIRGMYIDAFAHCAGMYPQLDEAPGYHLVSEASKGLLSKARADLEFRLAHAAIQLQGFSVDVLGGFRGPIVQMYMNTFRHFLLTFYTTRFGQFPPGPAGSSVFSRDFYHAMRDDFECLRDLLADERARPADAAPHDSSGLDVVRVLAEYDRRSGYAAQRHRMPLLPEVAPPRSAWRRLFARAGKLKLDDQVQMHAALVRSYNEDPGIADNGLVRAYRRFEEELATTGKRVSLCEGRKARWVVVYAVCQVLRHVTEAPKEVFDTEGIDYHVAVSTDHLPPWKEARRDAAFHSKTFQGRFSDDTATAPAMSNPRRGRADAQGASRLRHSIAHTAARISRSFGSRGVGRPPCAVKSATPPVYEVPPTPPRVTDLPPPPATGSASSSRSPSVSSGQGYETAPSTLDSPTPSLPDSASVAEVSTPATTPQPSPARLLPASTFHPEPEPALLPPLIPHPRAVSAAVARHEIVSIMPSPAHTPLAVTPSVSTRLKQRERPRSAEVCSNLEWASRTEVPGYAVDYAELVEREREEIYGVGDEAWG